jgi:PAT family beta-lactamase induction signal transducer AmpG
LFGIAYGLFQTYMPVLAVQELGWTDTAFSGLIGTAGLVAGIAAMVIANPILKRLEIKRSFTFFITVFALLGFVMGYIPALWKAVRTIQIFVFAYYGLRTFLLIILFTLAMIICQKTVAATQFALYTSIANLGISIGAAIYAPMESVFTYSQIFFVFALLLLLMLPIIKGIRPTNTTLIPD